MKLSMNSLYGEQIRKDIRESFACKSEVWMKSDYDEREIIGEYLMEIILLN